MARIDIAAQVYDGAPHLKYHAVFVRKQRRVAASVVLHEIHKRNFVANYQPAAKAEV
jgi:hypothetical protein